MESPRLVAIALAATLAAACSGGGSSRPIAVAPPTTLTGPITLLTADNPNGDEDDPFIALDPAGNVHVVWLSDRDGNKDIYHLKSTAINLATGLISWGPIEHLTEAVGVAGSQDIYPSIVIDTTGVIHLAWHRVTPQAVGAVSHIRYKRSDATGAFTAPNIGETNITSGLNYDRFPRLVRYAANDLRIVFNANNRKPASVGKNDIFRVKSQDNGGNWDAIPTEVASLNTVLAADEQSTLPNILKLANGTYAAVFTRWPAASVKDFIDPAADIFYSDSSDGETWTTPIRITQDSPDDKIDLAPAFFSDHAGIPYLAWATTRLGDPALDVIYLPLSQRLNYPAAALALNPLSGITDTSLKVLPLVISGQQVFLAVWVRFNNPPHAQVVYRLTSVL